MEWRVRRRMPNDSVWILDLNVPGRILSRGYATSLVVYTDLGVRYEVYMDNDDFIERDSEDSEDGSL